MTHQLTESELSELSEFVRLVESSLPHEIWSVGDIDIVWDNNDEASSTGATTMGRFKELSDVIELAYFGRHTPDLMVPTLCHELHHKWQCEHYGMIPYMVMKIARKWTIEPTAYEVETAAVVALEELI